MQSILPRFIRHRDAPGYLGMDKNRFNNDVRPTLIEIPMGQQGIAFDRVDLDAWADDYKEGNGRPSKSSTKAGDKLWDAKRPSVLLKGETSGTFRKQSSVSKFEKALEQAKQKKRS